ncbi:longevity assurance proteins LAG1/LAC1 [Clavulina sp. PMI_390]|nr:longevity assurance proteins LAG1/LAC1 [Clavulina sp. PMI_390]
MRWMTVPLSSLKLLGIVFVMWANWELITPFVAPDLANPFAPLIFISYRIPDSPADAPKYAKGPLDLLFLLYYVIVWSFVRQSLTLHILRPLARRLGIKKSAKLDRFGEQGYALLYFSFFGSLGIYVMSQLPTWWYRTEHFWIEYPHWQMTPLIKRYYLMQLAYWIQQLIVLILRLEKPRKDFTELVIHHLVTIWLVGWSYSVNLTYIGNAIFLTMDVSDVFLANAKLLNYLGLELTSSIAFAIFIPIWTYMRHYLNIRILISVWNEFDLIPMSARSFEPAKGIWMVWWMRYQIFIPILLLQFVNLFWSFLIWRILYRILFKGIVADERSDDEDDGEDEGAAPKRESKKQK